MFQSIFKYPYGKILPKHFVSVEKNSHTCVWSKVFLSIFYKVLPKQMCFGQYLNIHMEKCYWNTLFWLKKMARTVLDQKCFCQIFIKFYWNKCVLINILICRGTNFYQNKVFLSNFHKVLPNQTCFSQYFNIHMEKFYQNKVFLSNFHKVLLKQTCFSQYLNKCMEKYCINEFKLRIYIYSPQIIFCWTFP